MPLNLLWVLRSDPVQRPIYATPAWSWASVYGIITNPLKEDVSLRLHQLRSERGEARVLASKKFHILSPTKIDELVIMSRLKLRGVLRSFTPGLLNVVWDVADIDSGSKLFVLLVRSFVNAQVKRVNGKHRLHGIVVRHRVITS